MLQVIANGRGVRLESELDRRLRLAIARIVQDESFDDAFILEDVAHAPGYNRQFEDWCGDISGRYLGALALCSTYTGEEYPQLHRVARAILRYQRPDGLVGAEQPEDALDLKVAWGQGRLLVGLLEYHSVFPNEEVLGAARRLGDYYVRTLALWSDPAIRRHQHYPFYTQAIEGLVLLYRTTGEERYLEAARRMAALVPQEIVDETAPPDPSFTTFSGRHSHGYMSSLIGMLALYEVTGEAALLQQVRQACARIAAEMLFVDGTPPEFFPWSQRDEGCSTADWLTLNLRLGCLTHEHDYFEMAERVWRNALYGNQAANGGFCHHHLAPYGFTGEGNEAWWCCAYHGPRALYTLLRHLCTWDESAVQVQFAEPLDVSLPTPWGEVRLVQRTAYPSEGITEVVVEHGPAEGVPLRVRLPSWARLSEVLRNGRPVEPRLEAGYLRLAEPLRPREALMVRFPYGVRLGPEREGRRSLWYGPLLLAVEIPGGVAHAVVVPPEREGAVPLPSLPPVDSPFEVVGAHFKVVGVGNPLSGPLESLGLNRPQVGRARPLSEQTAYGAPPPVVVSLPVVVATSELLQAELGRALRGR